MGQVIPFRPRAGRRPTPQPDVPTDPGTSATWSPDQDKWLFEHTAPESEESES